MKLALVVPGGVDRSGEYRVIPALLALIRELARLHELHVFALYQEAQPACWELQGALIHNIGTRHTRVRGIAAILAEHRRAPFAAIQSIFSGACSQVAMIAGRLLRRPVAVHVAGGEIVALGDIGYGGGLRWHSRLAERWVLRRGKPITAASQGMIEQLAGMGIAANLLPLGVDLEQWQPRVPVPRDSARPAQLLHVASLNRVKDQPTLLRAMQQLAATGTEFSLDIVGEDTLRGEVQALAANLSLGARVRFHGFKTQRQLRPMVEAADVLVVSSRHEAGPIVVIEAAAAGVPTVGTAVGHVRDWAPDAAVAVPTGDFVALGNALADVLADEPRRLRLAVRAHQRALECSAARTAKQLVAGIATAVASR